MDPIAIASLVVGIIALYFAWLQIDYRFIKKKAPIVDIAHTDILKTILEKKVLRVGWFSYFPFVYADPLNPKCPIGLYALLVSKVASKFGLNVQWKQINLSQSVELIKNNKLDIVISVFQTPNRARLVDFTAFLHSITVGGVARNDIDDLHSQSELLRSTYSITVAEGEIGHELVDAIKISHSRVTIIDTNDISRIISLIKSGDSDIVLLDAVSIKNYFKRKTEIELNGIKQIFTKRPLAICHNGIMIAQNQIEFADWLDLEFRLARDLSEIAEYENRCLQGYEEEVSKS